jgi:hypothetical protein
MNPMKTLLDKLISEAPEEAKGAIPLQLQIGGQPYAGSVLHSQDYDGLYEMIVVDPQKRLAVSIYFEAKSISAIFVPKGETSPIMQPKRSGIITGAH